MPVKPQNAKTVSEYIDQIDEPRRSDIEALHELIRQTLPDLEPHILYGMLGYGHYGYKYASGREGDWSVLALASQKNYISLYVMGASEDKYIAESYKDRLPKANIGKSCVRFKKLADVDIKVITEMIQAGARAMAGGR